MEVKKKRFFALSRIERATKLFICLFVFLLINCSTVFATNQEITVDNIIQILNYFNTDGYDTTLYTEERLQEFVNTANTTQYGYIQYNKNTGLRLAYNFTPYIRYGGTTSERIEGTKRSWIYFNETENTYTSGTSTFGNTVIKNQDYMYCIGGWFTYGTSTIEVNDGWSNIDIISFYKQPYFEFSLTHVGKGDFENILKNVDVYEYNTNDIKSNDLYNMLRIGQLYIDKNYDIGEVLTSIPKIYKYSLDLSQSWTYDCYTIYTLIGNNIVGDYKVYNVNIDMNYISTPYYYSIFFESHDKNLSDNLNINFVLFQDEMKDITGSGGGTIITTPSGDIISGDNIKDNTTLGDIQNDIKEPYNPDSSILNTLNSGDILDNMGYQTTEDPNKDLWDTIINGLKEVLTGSGEQFLTFKFRSKTFNISSNDIMQPNSSLKVFTSLFVNFWLLMQMFTFIKKTIDQINEGNLKVMHDVDADCYFF